MITNYLKLARFDKPIGFLLLLWPTLWALIIAGNGNFNIKYFIIFMAGVIIMRSAGCIINDIADRNIDNLVLRTKERPLAAKIISLPNAILFFGAFSTAALFLALQLNFWALKLSVMAFCIASLYPFCKRVTNFPQIVLGVAFSFSILIVFAEHNIMPLSAWILFFANVIWTISYDTYYALADYEDDKKIGIKSPAVFFAQNDSIDNAIIFICILQTVFLFLLSLLGILLKFSITYYIFIFCIAILFCYQYKLGKSNSRSNFFSAFLNNNMVGLLIFIAIFREILC